MGRRLHMHGSPATLYNQIGHALDLADVRRTNESARFYVRGRVWVRKVEEVRIRINKK